MPTEDREMHKVEVAKDVFGIDYARAKSLHSEWKSVKE